MPDEYETIQGAINASEDGDTVRVREGIYEEGLWFYSKEILLESESGPERTTILGNGWNDVVTIAEGEDYLKTSLRGFTLRGSNSTGIQIRQMSGLSVYNCVIDGQGQDIVGLWTSSTTKLLAMNCVIRNCSLGLIESYTIGFAINNIIINCELGYHKIAINYNYFKKGWNLFWENGNNYRNTEPHESDVFANPLFQPDSYRLSEDSPAVNAGDPTISDKDGTRSDIGIYGGPYAYPPPEQGRTP